jgi:hypothetical protein
LAEAVSLALADHLPRAEAQKLVSPASSAALAPGENPLDIVAARIGARIDWRLLRADAERPACGDALIDRVLRTVA